MSGFKGVAAGRDGPVHRAANDPPGGSWNYRVIEFVDFDGSPWFSIHEVHYIDGKPRGYGETSADASSEDLEGIAWVLEKMGEALARPVLRERDFSGGALIVGPINPAEMSASSPAEGRAGTPATDELLQSQARRVEELEAFVRDVEDGLTWNSSVVQSFHRIATVVRDFKARSALSEGSGSSLELAPPDESGDACGATERAEG